VVRDVESQSSVERRGGASLALALDASLARVEAVERDGRNVFLARGTH
jgi:hypothetical protein